MTAKDVFELRKQGLTETAYETARMIYANDKSPYSSLAMFWAAVDVLRVRNGEGRHEEAHKILLALERMLPQVPDKEGWVKDAFLNCKLLLEKAEQRNTSDAKAPQHLETGIWGEELAAAYLRHKGYVILERDWRSGHRDIDIIARNSEFIVFVEVKTRRSADFCDPAKAVDYKKRRNIRQSMNHYIKYHHIDLPVRFDIITVVGQIGDESPEVNHLEDVNIMELNKKTHFFRRNMP